MAASTRQDLPVTFYNLPAEMVRLICYHLLLSDAGAIDALILTSPHIKKMIVEGGDSISFWKNKLDLHFPYAFVENEKSVMQLKRTLVKCYQLQVESLDKKGNLNELLNDKKVADYYLKDFWNSKRYVSLLASAKEGDIAMLADIIDGMKGIIIGNEKDPEQQVRIINRSIIDILLPVLKFKDDFGFSPFAYARKYKRQEWLNYCYGQISDKYPVAQLSGAIATLQPLSDIRQSLSDIRQYLELEKKQIWLAAACGHNEVVQCLLPPENSDEFIINLIEEALKSESLQLVAFLLNKITNAKWENREKINPHNIVLYHIDDGYAACEVLSVFDQSLETNNIEIIKLVLGITDKYFTHFESSYALGVIASKPMIRNAAVINHFLSAGELNKDQILKISLEAAGKGNVALLRGFFRHYSDLFYGELCYRLLSDYFSSCDDVKNNFIKVHELIDLFRLAWDKVKNKLLMDATKNNFSYDVLKLMIDCGAGVNFSNYSIGNVSNFSVGAFRCLVTECSDSNDGLVKEDFVKKLRLFKEKGADLNKVVLNSGGFTPLGLALMSKKYKSAKHLITLGAKVDCKVDDIFPEEREVFRDSYRRYLYGKSLLFRLEVNPQTRELCEYYLQSQVNDEAKRATLSYLLSYMHCRFQSPHEYLTSFFCIPFGCSKTEKLAAADALLRVLLKGDGGLSLLAPHQAALSQGKLGKFYNSPEVQHYLKPGVTEYDYVLPRFGF